MNIAPAGTARRSPDLPRVRGPYLSLTPKLADSGSLKEWDRRAHDENQLIVLDLFSGAGGLSQGFQDAGFFVAAGVDHDSRCSETHAANFASKAETADLKGISGAAVLAFVRGKLELPRVDVIIGGPPCQGFAVIGRAKIRSLSPEQRQVLESRNHLYREFMQFVESLQPLCVVMENVPSMGSFDNGAVVAGITEDFDRIGYEVGFADNPGQPVVLDAASYGVPQTRRRLFFIGFRRGRVARTSRPVPTHDSSSVQLRAGKPRKPQSAFHLIEQQQGQFKATPLLPARTLADAIADLPRIQAPMLEHDQPYRAETRIDLLERGALRDHTYRDLMRSQLDAGTEGVLYDHVVRPVREDDAEAFRHIPEGGTYRDVPPEYRRYRLEAKYFEDRYFRLRWDQPSRTITAHIAKDGYWYIHPDINQSRTLSVREAARIQSFPDHFRFAGHRTAMYRQIGNAVPPLLARVVAERLRLAIAGG